MNNKVMLGMSGGVDSAVSAFLLKEKGYKILGVNCLFTKRGKDTEKSALDAKSVADKIGIDFERLNLEAEFSERVLKSFCKSYADGGTPNPCIECNRHLKFGKMLDYALKSGYDYIATGHYARIEKDSEANRFLLKKGLDENKDQSYVLYMLTQHQLAHTLFPLGGLTKEEVRRTALELQLASAANSDSQDICFVPDGDYASFIEEYLSYSFPQGEFINTEGKILGTHKGIIRYTVGQRRGLGLALPAPLYVMKKDVENNRVILCDNESLFTKHLDATDINLIVADKLTSPLRVKAKVRYKHKEAPATVTQTGENSLHVEFDEPQRAIAKGQALVLYSDDIVIGGGTIL